MSRRWGTRPEAIEAHDQLASLTGKWAGNPGLCLGPVDYWLFRYSALIGDMDRARREIDRARQQCDDRGLDRWVARIDDTINSNS